MRSVKFLVAAGAASLLSSMAFAADMAHHAAAGIRAASGRRGFRRLVSARRYRISAISEVDRLNNVLDTSRIAHRSDPAQQLRHRGHLRARRRLQFNNWFRADVTGEYRGNSQFSGHGSPYLRGPHVGVDTIPRQQVTNGSCWQRLCRSRHLVVHDAVHRRRRRRCADLDQQFHDWASPTPAPARVGAAFGDNVAKWNFAWALHAGVAYKVTPNFTVELAYRYLDMGDGLTGDLRTFDGVNNVFNPMTFKNITSHDLKLGVRWDLQQPAGLCAAAADAQGLIEPSDRLTLLNGAGSSRAVLLCAAGPISQKSFPALTGDELQFSQQEHADRGPATTIG